MIYLDTPSKKIEFVLAGSVTTNALETSAHFFDLTPQSTTTVRRGTVQRATSNNTTDVSIVNAVALQGIIRNVHTIFCHNKDTATATVTIKIDDSGTETILVKQAIAAGESLIYEDGSGWTVLSPITPPFIDTTEIVRGSSDATKKLRIEVDGITSGATRVWTVADSDIKVAGHATGFTANRIPYATGSTGGVLTDSANLTFDGSTLALTGAQTVSGNFTLSALTANRVVYTTTGGLLAIDGDLTYDGTTLTSNTVDINGGAIDGTVIGASSAAAITGTTITANTSLTVHSVTSTGATGTGSIVFSASPTFTGTITAAAANFSGAMTGTTLTLTKATAGDSLTFTNGGASNKTGYLYSDATDVGLLDVALGGATFNGILLNRAGLATRIYANAVKVADFTSGATSLTGTLTTTGNVILPVGFGIYSGSVTTANLRFYGDATLAVARVGSGGTFHVQSSAPASVFSVTEAGNTTVTGTLAVSGNVTLGDATSDSHTINGHVNLVTASGADALSLSGYAALTWNNTNHLHIGGFNASQWQQVATWANGSEITRVTSTGLGVFTTPSYVLDIRGTPFSDRALNFAPTVTANAAGGNMWGAVLTPTIVEASSSTHPIVGGVYIGSTITNGGAGATIAANLYVDGLTAATGTTTAAALYVAGAATGASSNFSLYVAAGTAYFGSGLRSDGGTNLTAALTYGGVTLSNSVTGTGSMVLSASPTFTGTVNVAALTASGVITGTNAALTTPAFTGVPTGTVTSGTYTATQTAILNSTVSTNGTGQYMRVGNTVTVSTTGQFGAAVAGLAKVAIALPIASNFANGGQLTGVAIKQTGVTNPCEPALILADATNDRAEIWWEATGDAGANRNWYCTFSYQVI